MSTQGTQNGWASRYADIVIKFRWVVIFGLIVATALMATQVPKLDVRNDPDTLLPPSNRYVATNAYAEENFGMGNLLVFSLSPKTGHDIYQPWFINMVQEVHRKLEALPYPRPENFIDIAAQKIKYMHTDEGGGLVFKRLIPTSGISDDPKVAKEQLAFLREGIKTNPVMAPMLTSMFDKDGHKCHFDDYDKDECVAKAAYVIADYTDEVKQVYLPWVSAVRDIMEEYKKDPRVDVLVAGEPYFLALMLKDLIEKWWLFLISIAIVIAVLWAEFRNWRGALFPLIGVGMTITLTLGLMGFSEFKLTTMMVLTPMLLLAIGIGHSVQVTRRFMTEQQDNGGDCDEAARVAISHTIIPATLSIVTDMVGFATLATVDISFYKAYAYFGMFGMLTLLMTTTTLIPLLLTVFPCKIMEEKEHTKKSWEHYVGGFITRLISGPGMIVPIAFVAAVISVSVYYTNIFNWKGIAEDEIRLTEENDIMPGVEKGINYARAAFKGNTDVWKDLVKLNEVMPGVISVSIPIRGKEPLTRGCKDIYYPDEIYEIESLKEKEVACAAAKKELGCWDADACGEQGIFNDAEVMQDMEAMENWMRDHQFIGYTGSYVQYIRLVNMLLQAEGGEAPNKTDLLIPTQDYLDSMGQDFTTPNAVVQLYNGLLETMTSAGEMDSFIDVVTWNEGVILGFINTMIPKETHQVTMDIQQYIEDHKNDKGFAKVNFGLRNDTTEGDTNNLSVEGPGYVRPGLGGFLGATEATREVAMDNWLTGPLLTAAAVFLMAALMFRSVMVAAILISTLLITLFAQYGLGGYYTSVEEWSGNLAFHLLVTLSIAMGLGVDYGIYMMSRLREEMLETGGQWAESLSNTLNTTGSAVIISVIVLLGSFIPLVNTSLANTWGLSIFIGEALLIDVVTALMLLPLLVKWLKPKYVWEA